MDVTRSGGYSGRPYTLYLRVYTIQVSGNSSRYHHDAWGHSNSGYGSYTYNDSHCEVWVGNDYWAHFVGEMLFGPSGDYAGKTIGWGSGDGNWMGHDGNGNLGFTIRAYHPAPGPFNAADTATHWVTGDRIGEAPGQVGGVGASNLTPTSATISWSTPYRGHSDINNYDLHVCDTDGGLNTGVGCAWYNWTSSTATNKSLTNLNPGTTYSVQVRAQNGDGVGPWSTIYRFTTLPSTPPTLVVVASPAGSAATITLTPPSGVVGVNSYTVTREYIAPTPIPNPATETYTTNTNTLTVTGLTPGATYRWTATATIGTYTSPVSAPVNVTQPKPNTSPGDFFDGNTTDTPDIDYGWTGTANNSTSTATGVGVDGWTLEAVGAGGAASVYRTTGGYAGEFSALMLITRGATAAGFRAGQANLAGKRTDVEVGAMYVGSMYVMPSRSQRLVAELTWINAAGGVVSRSLGNQASVPASVWTRLIAADVAPATAEFALIRVVDVAGDGWSAWQSGESLRMDAAMISLGQVFPYFDGDTVDTTEYAYDWEGTPNASTSQRSALASNYDPLNDPDCVDVPASPRPPVVPSDCIVDVGLWRRYWAYIPAVDVSDWLTTIPTLMLTTFGAPERQVRVRFYADPFSRPAELVNTSDFCSEQIISYIPPSTTLTLDGVSQRVWASVSGGGSLSADHLLYGSGGTPAEWPHLSCGIGYWVSLDVPNEAPAGNLSVRVLVTQRV